MKLKFAVFVGAMTLLTNVDAMGQNPYEDVEQTEWDIIVKSKSSSPTIVDIITSYLSETEDEMHGALSQAWQRYLKQEPAEKGATMFVDTKNGYVSYTEDYDLAYPEDPSGVISVIEMCLWNCADGTHKVFAENVVLTQNGEVIQTEFTGISFYLYDKNTKRLTLMHDFIELEYDMSITFELPQKGKDIVATIHSPSGEIQKTLVWDGYRFHLAK